MEIESTKKQKDAIEDEDKKIQFLCKECKMSELVDYFGSKKPSFVKNVTFDEDTYVMKDPFSAPPSRHGKRSFTEYFIAIGSICALCHESFCKDCSLFFNSTFCYRCSYENVSKFPLEIQSKIRREYLAIKNL
jgi:Cysteine-rich domain